MDKIEDLLVNKGLYDAVDISVEDLNEMQKYLSKSEYTNNNIDCYSYKCVTVKIIPLLCRGRKVL